MEALSDAAGFSRDADVPGVVTEFLKKSLDVDVFIEFIQNELDAGSTQTVFSFGPNAFMCQGDGCSIDEPGWKRLRTAVGAGSKRVPRKVGGIGAKNHGLRTGFRVADDIIVASAGQSAKLTLWGPDSADGEIDPGCWPLEIVADAPVTGARVTLPLRKSPLHLETLTLSGLSAHDAERHFHEAVAQAPRRFIGVMAPGVRSAWTLVLKWPGEEVTLDFRAGPIRNGVFERSCTRRGAEAPLVRERVWVFRIAHLDDWKNRKVDFFVRNDWVGGEISWPVDSRGRSVAGEGGLRYPIAYPISDTARAHAGFSISAPFESEDSRYAPARGHAGNRSLVERAEEAFLTEVLPMLLEKEGARALQLLRDSVTPDPAKEQEFGARAIATGAVAVHALDGERRLAEVKARGAVTVAASGRSGLERADSRLFGFAPRSATILSAKTPSFFVQALMRAAPLEDARFYVAWLRPAELVQQAIGVPQASTSVASLKRLLDLIARLHDDGVAGDTLLKRLADEGELPQRSGGWIPWKDAKWLKDDVPVVPGAPQPPVVRKEFNDCPLIRTGLIKRNLFKLDGHLQGADFTGAPLDQRSRFFDWLHRQWRDLAPSTLGDLSAQPVWPSADGDMLPLSDICLLRQKATAGLLAGFIQAPGEQLRRFRGFKAGSRSTLRMRYQPRASELYAWYQTRREWLNESANNETAALEARRLDDDLLTLLDDDDIGPAAVRALGPHLTAARDGSLAAVGDLHLETEKVRACALLSADLLPVGHKRLYQLFDARREPAPGAILGALKSDPKSDQVLYQRLAALRQHGGQQDLSAEMFIPTPVGLASPSQLKLRSARIVERDLWGSWRREYAPEDPDPRRLDLLRWAGIAPLELTAPMSRAFFIWLGTQPSDVQEQNLRQVMRHWMNPAYGPVAWWKTPTYAAVRCLPVRSGASVRLVSHSELARAKKTIILPDDRELEVLVLRRDQQVSMIIVTVEDVAGSILHILRGDPDVRSLRVAAGAPLAVVPEGAQQNAADLLALVRRLHVGKVSEILPKTLQQFEVPAEDLRQNWRHILGGIESVVLADRVRIRRRVRSFDYDTSVKGAADVTQGTIFVSREGDPLRGLYDAIAQLILRRTTSMSGAAVQNAAESESYDFRFSGPRGPAREPDADPASPGGADPENLRAGHHERAAIDTLPDPNDFNPAGVDPKGPKRHPPLPSGRQRRPQAQTARDTVQEAQEKQELRVRHYSYHCQACLGTYQPSQVAPHDSYLSEASYRADLLDAHHVDHIQTEVILGARNLLLLCKHHHATLGDALTGAKVLAALKKATPVSRRFEASGENRTLSGPLARIPVDIQDGEAFLFFTEEHARAWLTRSSSANRE